MSPAASAAVIRNPLGEAAQAPAQTAAETVYENHLWAYARPRISICVPVYRTDASGLVAALSGCVNSALAELIVYDDGGGMPGLVAGLEHAADGAAMAVRIVSADRNLGRAAARNRLIAHARANWVLLLDADMWPDSLDFIRDYVSASEAAGRPAVIVGGYSLLHASQERRFALHRWQALRSECLPSGARRQAPGRHVFTSNVLAHKKVLQSCGFDEGFSGWGWEDTDWGLRCEPNFPVLHIDNTATHLGLDDTRSLMRKYAASGPNFARLADRHDEAMSRTPLMRASIAARRLPKPLRALARGVSGAVARLGFGLPVSVRGRAMKVWRALVYAEHI